jgi:hypothetical protein
MKISTQLKERDKLIIALLCTIAIIGGIIAASNWYSKRDLPIVLNKNNDNSDTQDDEAIAKLSKIKPTNTKDLLYSDISFLDLPIYPQAWVKRNFSVSDEVNLLVSGPSGDPDKDGLINKEEYFYGSDPQKKISLCINEKEGCDKPNDKQAVDSNISPLTGLDLVTPKKFSIKKQDYAIINRIEESFETAAEEGVDFPTLYQLSRKIDLSPELNSIKILITENSRESLLNYINLRVDLLENYSEENELTNFIEVYETSNIQELTDIKKKYIELEEKLTNNYVPKKYTDAHQAYILLFKKFQQLIDIRINGLSQTDVNIEQFRSVSKEKSTELVWVYRFISESEERIKKTDDKEKAEGKEVISEKVIEKNNTIDNSNKKN